MNNVKEYTVKFSIAVIVDAKDEMEASVRAREDLRNNFHDKNGIVDNLIFVSADEYKDGN